MDCHVCSPVAHPSSRLHRHQALFKPCAATPRRQPVVATGISPACAHWSESPSAKALQHVCGGRGRRREYVRVQAAATDGQLTEPAAPADELPLDQQLAQMCLEVDTAVGKVLIRCVEAADVMGACVVLTRAFAGTAEEIGLNDAKKYVDNVVGNPAGGALFVARLFPTDTSLLPPNQSSRLIGTVALSLREDTLQQIPTLPPPPNTAYLSNMAVDAKFRRMGVARALMRICDKATRAAGLKDIYLHVRQGDDAASNLYSSSGFHEVARDSFLAARLKNVRPRVLMRKSVA